LKKSKKIIVLDPGHGGADTGARFKMPPILGISEKPAFIYEKDIVLNIALLCQNYMETLFKNVEVYLTRSGDNYLKLNTRTIKARNWGADAFVSVHCFPAGTEITMADGVIKPIEDVLVGEYVMNSSGMPTRVKSTYSRYYSGPLVKIKPYKSNLELLPTPEHPIASDYGGSSKQWGYIKARDLKKTQRVALPIHSFTVPISEIDLAQILRPIYHFDVEDEQIWIKRSLFTKKPRNNKAIPRYVHIDNDLLWLLGIFSADGSNQLIRHYGKMSFGFNRDKDRNKATRCAEIFKKIFAIDMVLNDRKTAHVIDGYILSSVVCQLFDYLVSGKAEHRHLSSLLMLLPQKQQHHLLNGWLDGDGTIYPDRLKGDSISRSMLNQYYQIALRCGMHPSYQKIEFTSGYGSTKPNHRLSCSAHDLCGETPKANVFYRQYPKGLAVELKDLSRLDFEGDVYNLETDTKSYVANKIAVHNCNADPDEDFPDMPEASGEEIWVYSKESKGYALAQSIEKYLKNIFPKSPYRGIKESKSLYVLRETAMPACLVECGFIDAVKRGDLSYLISGEGQTEIAVAIADGITDYLLEMDVQSQN